MNLDDETTLSAFLDNEIAPGDRAAVAWSIESSPAMARQLRSLADARDAVAGLSRPPAPADVSARVVAQLAVVSRAARRRRIATRLAEVGAIGGVCSLAACLFAAIFFIHRATHPDPAGQAQPELFVALLPPAPAPATAPIPAVPPLMDRLEPEIIRRARAARQAGPVLAKSGRFAEPVLAERARQDAAGDEPPVPPPASLAMAPGPMDLPAAAAVMAPKAELIPPGPTREQAERAQIAGMLDRPDVHRIVIVTDVVDAGRRVKDLFQNDVRQQAELGCVSVSGGIVIDPGHPGDAEVYAVVLDPRESARLLGAIDRAFPKTEVVVDTKPDPAMLAQLSKVGRVSVLPGQPIENLAALSMMMEAQEEPLPSRVELQRNQPELAKAPDPAPAPAQAQARAKTEALPPPAVERKAVAKLDQPAVVARSRPAEARQADPERPGADPGRDRAPFPPTPGPTTYLVWVTRPQVRR